jgi:homogentisate phytyltransferase/homogentisate geranylgeranyltransferase
MLVYGVLSLIMSSLVWRFFMRPSVDGCERPDENSKDTMRGMLEFARPHTIKGTFLASVSGYLVLSIYHGSHAYICLILVLMSGVLANVFIVGINQLIDVDTDIVNKKNLPLVTKGLRWTTGRRITGRCFVLATSIAFLQSVQWGVTVSAMCLIGYMYSVPPLRLKRFAVPAALCIVSARALLGTFGGVYTYSSAMGREVDEYMHFHLLVFTGILIAFTTVIALMKDVPDIEGDRQEGVRSLSIVLGPGTVSRLCITILSAMYVGVIAVMWTNSKTCILTHLCGLVWLGGATIAGSSKTIAMHNYFNVVWPLFYFEFPAYLVPISLRHMGLEIPVNALWFVFGLEIAYLLHFKRMTSARQHSESVSAQILSKSGLDVHSLFTNLRLKGSFPFVESSGLVAEAAVEMSLALNMHSKLTRLTGRSFRDAKKLAILCGDWLLARAVMALCGTQDQKAIHEMGKSILQATQTREDEISNKVMQHAQVAINS